MQEEKEGGKTRIIRQGHEDDVGFESEKTWRSVPLMSACLKVGLCTD